ncbi:STAS domain-containing protein [Bacillus sp. BRMEA1]|nr:STAS domain-containing protein [Neobacillus endophyticus]
MVNDGIKMTVHLKGDMDIEITEVMEEELIPALQKAQEVELNFAAVSFVDSTGIGLLMNLVQHLKEREILVKITHLSEDIYEVFDLLQIPDIIGRDVFSS